MRRTAIQLLLFVSLASPAAAADSPSAMNLAREAIDRQDYAAAIATLERALPKANGNSACLSLLRSAYRAEIQRLVAADDRAAAQKHLDRLRLIESESAGTSLDDFVQRARPRDSVKVIMPDPAAAPPQVPVAKSAGKPTREAGSEGIAPSQNPAAGAAGWRPARQSLGATRSVAADARGDAPRSIASPSARVRAAQPAATKSTGPDDNAARALRRVKQADALFLAREYRQAGELYTEAHALAPESVRSAQDRWVYCRLVRTVEFINGGADPDQRAAIDPDLRAVAERLPNHAFAKNLVQLASQPNTAELAAAPPNPVVRASEPEAADLSDRGLLAGLAARIGLASSGSTANRSPWKRFRSGNWQVLEASNFRVHASDENLAGQIADIAECTRNELYRTWYGKLPESNWSPKCDIYIHDTADQYARLTRQGPGSPGHSQTGIDRGRIVSRRIDLRRDGPDLTLAILPHEVTHVVLADRFATKPMPRWADEGMAVLTEPVEKKEAHLKNLRDIARRGRLYSARQLMTMNDYPSGEQWPMFYAQSVSLVDFLVSRSGPARFVEFMQGALDAGYEPELKRVYGFASYEELDREWSRGRENQLAANKK